MGRRRTACETCNAIKTQCTKGSPCARCKRLALPCSLGNSDAVPRRSPPRSAKIRTKAKHTKSAKGCWNCRQRRKKCDEKEPVCTDCDRLGLTCVRPMDLEQGSPPQSSPAQSSPASSTETVPLLTDNLLSSDAFLEWTANDHGNEDAERVSVFSSDWLPLMESDNRIETARNARLANSTALVSLIKDDGGPALGTFLPPTALNNLTGVTPDLVKDWTTGERHLLNHFLQSVSRALVVVEDESNPFLAVVVPMALENTMVRHALTALSACHLSRVYPDFEYDLCIHRGKALNGLMTELQNNEASIWSLATTLLLCLVEVCIGNSRRWLLHLHGARNLILQTGHQLSHPAATRLVAIYNYLACMTSVTSSIAPAKIDNSLVFPDMDAMPETNLIHPFFGISSDLYDCVSDIGYLSTSNHVTSAIGSPGLDAEAMELRIQSWVPPTLTTQSRNIMEARALGFALQWASIIHLLQVSKKLRNDDPLILKAVDNILSALSLIRPGSEMEARMLFPLFMAGVGSMTKSNRLTVEYRLDVMEVTIGFGNISTAHKLLDEIWRKANEGNISDWQELVKNKYQGLVLF